MAWAFPGRRRGCITHNNIGELRKNKAKKITSYEQSKNFHRLIDRESEAVPNETPETRSVAATGVRGSR